MPCSAQPRSSRARVAVVERDGATITYADDPDGLVQDLAVSRITEGGVAKIRFAESNSAIRVARAGL